MFCSKCGKQIPDDSVFCSGCGAKVGEAPASSAPAETDTNKVLKEEGFRLYEGMTNVFSKKYDGVLVLYADRLEWKGTPGFTVPAAAITRVKKELLGVSDIGLVVYADKTYKFLPLRKSVLKDLVAISFSSDPQAQALDSWCSAIDKVCGRL